MSQLDGISEAAVVPVAVSAAAGEDRSVAADAAPAAASEDRSVAADAAPAAAGEDPIVAADAAPAAASEDRSVAADAAPAAGSKDRSVAADAAPAAAAPAAASEDRSVASDSLDGALVEAAALVDPYAEVVEVSPWAFHAFWFPAPAKSELESVKRGAYIVQNYAVSTAGFLAVRNVLVYEGRKYGCLCQLSGPQMNLVRFFIETDNPRQQHLVLEHTPVCFHWMSALEVQSTFIHFPFNDHWFVFVRGRHSLAVYKVAKKTDIEDDLTDDTSLLPFGVELVLDLEEPRRRSWIDMALSPYNLGEVIILSAHFGDLTILNPLTGTEVHLDVKRQQCLPQTLTPATPDDPLTLAQGLLDNAHAEGTIYMEEEALNAIEYSYTRQLLLVAGKKIWHLNLQTQTASVIFPPVRNARIWQTLGDEVSSGDFGFVALCSHPDRLWLVGAYSVGSNCVFLLDVRHTPALLVAHLPASDIYQTSNFPKKMLWVPKNRQFGAFSRQTEAQRDFLLVSFPFTFSPQLATGVFHYSFEDTCWPQCHWRPVDAEEEARTLFDFCIFDFSIYGRHQHKVDGLLRGIGDLGLQSRYQTKMLLGAKVHKQEALVNCQTLTQDIQNAIASKYMFPESHLTAYTKGQTYTINPQSILKRLWSRQSATAAPLDDDAPLPDDDDAPLPDDDDAPLPDGDDQSQQLPATLEASMSEESAPDSGLATDKMSEREKYFEAEAVDASQRCLKDISEESNWLDSVQEGQTLNLTQDHSTLNLTQDHSTLNLTQDDLPTSSQEVVARVQGEEVEERHLGIADADYLTQKVSPWTCQDLEGELEKKSHYLAMPYPICGCGLGDDDTFEYQFTDGDVVGPLDRTVACCPRRCEGGSTALKKLLGSPWCFEPADANSALAPAGTTESVHRTLVRDGCTLVRDGCTLVRDGCKGVEGECGRLGRTAKGGEMEEIRAAKGGLTVLSSRMTLGVRINENLVKMLEEEWEVPSLSGGAGDDLTVHERGRWVKVVDESESLAEAAEKAETFRRLLESAAWR